MLRLELLGQQEELTHGALLPALRRFGDLLDSHVGAHFLGAQNLDGDTTGHHGGGAAAQEGRVAGAAVKAILQRSEWMNAGE